MRWDVSEPFMMAQKHILRTHLFRGAAWTVLALSLTACSSHVQTDRYGTSGHQSQTTSGYSYSSQSEVKATRYGDPVSAAPCGVTLQPCGYVVQYVAVPPPLLIPQPLRPQIECCDPPIISEPPVITPEPPVYQPPVIPPSPQPSIYEPPVYEPPVYEPPVSYPPIDHTEPPVWVPPKK